MEGFLFIHSDFSLSMVKEITLASLSAIQQFQSSSNFSWMNKEALTSGNRHQCFNPHPDVKLDVSYFFFYIFPRNKISIHIQLLARCK
jgi:hypothetical protein